MNKELPDSYQTFKNPSEGIYKDKGSRFIALGYPVENEIQIKDILTTLKKKFHDARHFCYAYAIGPGHQIYRMNDDGEPSGTAGKPIFNQLISNNLSDILMVVIRYFGGTLLGTSGLINAYKQATKNCIENAQIEKKLVQKVIKISFGYDLLNSVMRIIKDHDLTQFDQSYDGINCRFSISVRLSYYDIVSDKFNSIYGIEVVSD